MQCDKGMSFVGGESAAIGRVTEYFWKKVAFQESCFFFFHPHYVNYNPQLCRISLNSMSSIFVCEYKHYAVIKYEIFYRC